MGEFPYEAARETSRAQSVIRARPRGHRARKQTLAVVRSPLRPRARASLDALETRASRSERFLFLVRVASHRLARRSRVTHHARAALCRVRVSAFTASRRRWRASRPRASTSRRDSRSNIERDRDRVELVARRARRRPRTCERRARGQRAR